MKKIYCVFSDKYKKFEKPKISYILEKHSFLLLFAVSVRMKILENSIEILKILGLIENI